MRGWCLRVYMSGWCLTGNILVVMGLGRVDYTVNSKVFDMTQIV